MGVEKRLKPRIATDIELTILKSGKFEWSSLRNLSGGGVFVETDDPQPVDSAVSMQLKLPGDSELMDIEGRVIWIKQPGAAIAAGMGIEFTDITMQHQEKIMSFTESRLRELQKCSA